MIKKLLPRILLMVLLLMSLSFAVVETLRAKMDRDNFEQSRERKFLMARVIRDQQDYLLNISQKELKLVHREARRRGYHLPGEVDWQVLESKNFLRWPEFWGNLDIRENP